MENTSFAFCPNKNRIVLKVYANLKDEEGNLDVEDHLVFYEEFVLPLNIWNLILGIDEK